MLDGNRSRLILPINEQNSMIYIRKTGLPTKLQADPSPEVGLWPIREGVRVRIVSTPFLGLQGKVEAIDQTLTKLPSGLETYLVTVGSGSRKIRVPYSNLEVMALCDERN